MIYDCNLITWHFVILFNWLKGLNTAWYRSQLTAARDHISAKAPTDEQTPYILQPMKFIAIIIILLTSSKIEFILTFHTNWSYNYYHYLICLEKVISENPAMPQRSNITRSQNPQKEGLEVADSMRYGAYGFWK